jgi:hypothetical protein
MIYFLGILINLALGYLLIRLLAGKQQFNSILHMLLALVLGLGISSSVTFYAQILLSQFNRWIPVGIVVLGIIVSLRAKRSNLLKEIATSPSAPRNDMIIALLTLSVLAIPLAISGHYYPLGGWDAWSCWSLKAKFIFLGQENWKDVLSPGLWRSNTHYPLLWPLINVWFWDLGGRFDQAVPMLNSIVFALLTAGILLFGILELTGNLLTSILAAVVVTALPFGITLYTSQYSDSLLGLFLLSAFMALLLAEKYKLPKLKILSMVFLGLMSFTKNEGLMAAGIAGALIIYREIVSTKKQHRNDTGKLIFWFILAALPTIIFTLFMAPKNEAFINGLLSSDKPTTLSRLSVILVYPFFEFISSKWNGLWLLVFGGILLSGKKLWQSTLGLIGLTLLLYMGVVMAYYAVNTFFEIQWWLSTTLSRILFALVPTIALWISLGL